MPLFLWLVGDDICLLMQVSEHKFCCNVIIPFFLGFSWGFHPCVVLQGCTWEQRKDPHCVALSIS